MSKQRVLVVEIRFALQKKKMFDQQKFVILGGTKKKRGVLRTCRVTSLSAALEVGEGATGCGASTLGMAACSCKGFNNASRSIIYHLSAL